MKRGSLSRSEAQVGDLAGGRHRGVGIDQVFFPMVRARVWK